MDVPRPPAALTLRLLLLNAGLALMGFGTALMLAAGMGVAPWAVFHEGASLNVGISHGTVSQLVGLALLLAAWLWLRQRPGLGTVLNMVLIGLWIDVFRSQGWLPHPEALGARALQHLGATVLYAFASAMYLVADLGAGPRDGVMLGASRRFGAPVRKVRSAIEVLLLACGWALGGPVGLGTVIYALAVGPLVQAFMGRLRAVIRPAVARAGCARSTSGKPPTRPGRHERRTPASPPP